MRILRLSLQFGLFITLFFVIACAQTKFIIWKDETYQGHPKKILVINAFQNVENRKSFEDELVKALKDRGVDSVMRYAVIDDPVMSDKSVIAAQAQEVGADSVMITRPVGTRLGIAGTWDMFVNTQTDMYDIKSNRLILIASAETQIPEGKPSPNQIQNFVRDLLNQLSRLGLF
jgi:hypothetical protein